MNINHFETYIIGFDARESWLSFSQLWDTNRKELYLLSSDVMKPLSVDMNVWFTILKAGGTVSPSAYDADLDNFERIEPPDDLHGNSPLFGSSEELKNAIRQEWRFSDKPVDVVAITYLYDQTIEPSDSWPRVGMVSENIRDNWMFLGYDIADAGLISGLLGCGYTRDERQTATQRWAQSLNENHLFENLAAAMSFKEWTDSRVTEHAPFSVYGLYRICRV